MTYLWDSIPRVTTWMHPSNVHSSHTIHNNLHLDLSSPKSMEFSNSLQHNITTYTTSYSKTKTKTTHVHKHSTCTKNALKGLTRVWNLITNQVHTSHGLIGVCWNYSETFISKRSISIIFIFMLGWSNGHTSWTN